MLVAFISIYGSLFMNSDFTSLSDLVQTPQKEKRQERELNTSKAKTLFPDEKNDNDNDNEEDNKAANDNLVETEFKRLVDRQKLKVELFEKRDTLIKRRMALKSSFEDLKFNLKTLNDTKAKLVSESSMGDLINQNNDQFLPNLQDKYSDSLDLDHDDSTHILNHLNVSPSKDWIERLALIRKYLLSIDIDQINIYTDVNNEDFEIRRIYTFWIVSPSLFKVPIKIIVEGESQCLHEILLQHDDRKFNVLQLNTMSPSLVDILINDWVPNLKINSIIYGLNSLAAMTKKKVMLFCDIMIKFKGYLANKPFWDNVLDTQLSNRDSKLYSQLKSLDTLQFEVPASSTTSSHKVILRWEILLDDKIRSRCDSRITLFISKNSDSSIIPDVNTVFLQLVESYGMINALCIIFKNVFNITVN